MFRQRLAITWIACFAVLFNMLAMPLASAGANTSNAAITEQLLLGSFCSSTGTRLVAISLGSAEQSTPAGDLHSTMQHCWCCSGAAPLVGLPGHSPQLHLASGDFRALNSQAQVDSPTPRQQWPSLNPRASPLA